MKVSRIRNALQAEALARVDFCGIHHQHHLSDPILCPYGPLKRRYRKKTTNQTQATVSSRHQGIDRHVENSASISAGLLGHVTKQPTLHHATVVPDCSPRALHVAQDSASQVAAMVRLVSVRRWVKSTRLHLWD